MHRPSPAKAAWTWRTDPPDTDRVAPGQATSKVRGAPPLHTAVAWRRLATWTTYSAEMSSGYVKFPGYWCREEATVVEGLGTLVPATGTVVVLVGRLVGEPGAAPVAPAPAALAGGVVVDPDPPVGLVAPSGAPPVKAGREVPGEAGPVGLAARAGLVGRTSDGLTTTVVMVATWADGAARDPVGRATGPPERAGWARVETAATRDMRAKATARTVHQWGPRCAGGSVGGNCPVPLSPPVSTRRR